MQFALYPIKRLRSARRMKKTIVCVWHNRRRKGEGMNKEQRDELERAWAQFKSDIVKEKPFRQIYDVLAWTAVRFARWLG